jgi:hypothetical protein
MHCAAHLHTLNRKNAKALVVGSECVALALVWFPKDYLSLFLIFKVITTTRPIIPTNGVPKMNQSSVICGLNLKCPCDPVMPTTKRKHPIIITQEKNTISKRMIYSYSFSYALVGVLHQQACYTCQGARNLLTSNIAIFICPLNYQRNMQSL